MTLHYVFALWHNALTLWRQVITCEGYRSVLIEIVMASYCYHHSVHTGIVMGSQSYSFKQSSVIASKRKRYLCNKRPLSNPVRNVQILTRLTMPAPRQRMPPPSWKSHLSGISHTERWDSHSLVLGKFRLSDKHFYLFSSLHSYTKPAWNCDRYSIIAISLLYFFALLLTLHSCGRTLSLLIVITPRRR